MRALSGRITGRVLTPLDGAYDDARRLYNAAVEHRPEVIVQAAGVPDVVSAVRFATAHGLSLSVRSGGHGVAGHATSGDLVVDLSLLRAVRVDSVRRVADAQAGARWSDVDVATQRHALGTPGGRVTTTGIAGLTLGGGHGWLSPLHGLTCDNLLGAELVTADGRVVTVDEDHEPDLLWALRGGGGNFGVVTRFTYRLHPVGPVVAGGVVCYPGERAADVAAAYSAFSASAPPEVGGSLVVEVTPRTPRLPAGTGRRTIVTLILTWVGADLDAGARVLAPLRRVAPPLVDDVARRSYLELQAMTDLANRPGFRNYWSASYLRSPTPELVAGVADAFGPGSPQSQAIFTPLGRAVREWPPETAAFAHREAGWFFHPLAVYVEPTEDAAQRVWARRLVQQAAPYASGGEYLNFSSDEDAAHACAAYDPATYERLRRVKRVWDPSNVFRHTANVPPAEADGDPR
ncbi:MAG TPA: FAD-binding oxidoreductase [Mycobacteriales bacterium]|nr:FAD-binding oxidoreductase [Mycobacteriales bacterium]